MHPSATRPIQYYNSNILRMLTQNGGGVVVRVLQSSAEVDTSVLAVLDCVPQVRSHAKQIWQWVTAA